MWINLSSASGTCRSKSRRDRSIVSITKQGRPRRTESALVHEERYLRGWSREVANPSDATPYHWPIPHGSASENDGDGDDGSGSAYVERPCFVLLGYTGNLVIGCARRCLYQVGSRIEALAPPRVKRESRKFCEL